MLLESMYLYISYVVGKYEFIHFLCCWKVCIYTFPMWLESMNLYISYVVGKYVFIHFLCGWKVCVTLCCDLCSVLSTHCSLGTE